jgi:membrane-bound serine protease (ClpP class)
VVGVSMVSGVIFFTIMMIAVRAQRTPVYTGGESMSGKVGVVRSDLTPKGSVQVGGELWSAELEGGGGKIPAGTRVEVVRLEGLRLIVRKVE